jgi:hypothetical protein
MSRLFKSAVEYLVEQGGPGLPFFPAEEGRRARAFLKARRLARKAVRAHNTCPVRFLFNDDPPQLFGESWYYTTPSGKTRIRHPNAYHWPKSYHSSTLEVVVGVYWFRNQLSPEELALLVEEVVLNRENA